MTRLEANREILKVLETLVEVYKDQRFGQIICNYIIPEYQKIDPFFIESEATLDRMRQNLGTIVPDKLEIEAADKPISTNKLYLIETLNDKENKRYFLVSAPTVANAICLVQNEWCYPEEEIVHFEKVKDLVDTDKSMEGKTYIKLHN